MYRGVLGEGAVSILKVGGAHLVRGWENHMGNSVCLVKKFQSKGRSDAVEERKTLVTLGGKTGKHGKGGVL